MPEQERDVDLGHRVRSRRRASEAERCGAGEFQVGILGTLTLHEWAQRLMDGGEFDVDAYGLLADWSLLTGAGAVDGDGRTDGASRWLHHDAGGDWTQDGAVRRLGWLIAGLGAPAGCTVPVHEVLQALERSILRVGKMILAGVEAKLPIACLGAAEVQIRAFAGRDWVQIGSNLDQRREIQVRLDVNQGGLQAEQLVQTIQAIGGNALEAVQSPVAPDAGVAGCTLTLPYWDSVSAGWLLDLLSVAVAAQADTGGHGVLEISLTEGPAK